MYLLFEIHLLNPQYQYYLKNLKFLMYQLNLRY
jgi:hypothetical protein